MNWLFLQNDLPKIKPIRMQTSKIIQAVILMMLVALAASCTAGKIYSSRLFTAKPVTPSANDRRDPANSAADTAVTAVQPEKLTKPVSTATPFVIVQSTTTAPADSSRKNQPPAGSTNGAVRTKKTRDD